MIKYKVNDITELFIKNHAFTFSQEFNDINTLINQHTLYYKINIERTYEIIDQGVTYLAVSSEGIFKTICHLLNVPYQEIDEYNRLKYYSSIFKNKISKYAKINSLDVLQVEFPTIYEMFVEKLKKIEAAVSTQLTTARIIPKTDAESIKARMLYENKITSEEEYQNLLNESHYFNYPYFERVMESDLNIIVDLLPHILEKESHLYIEIGNIPGIKENEVKKLTQQKRLQS